MRKVINFLNSSAKHTALLKVANKNNDSQSNNKEHFISLCITKYVEWNTAIQTFRSLSPFIISSLEQITKWQSSDTRNSAQTLPNAIAQPDFISTQQLTARQLTIVKWPPCKPTAKQTSEADRPSSKLTTIYTMQGLGRTPTVEVHMQRTNRSKSLMVGGDVAPMGHVDQWDSAIF